MPEPPTIETERLVLRGYRPGDARAIFGLGADPLATRFMVWPRHRTLRDSEKALDYFLSSYGKGTDLPLGLWKKDGETLAGHAGFERPLQEVSWASWILRSEYWGQGLAFEALAALIPWGWANFQAWTRIEAPIHPGNDASIRLARKLGFVQVPSELRFKMTNLDGETHAATLWSLARP